MSPTFRRARPDDLPDAARLAAHSFPAVGRTRAQWEESLAGEPHGGLDALWVGEDGGGLSSICKLYRFEQWIGGERYPVMGLGTVAIAPTHRRRGLAARLLVSGFRHALERGDLATALYPFRTSFYQRLGYGMAGEALQYQLPPDAIPDAPERERVRLVTGDEDRARVRAVYDAWAPTRTGQMRRDARAWEPVWEGESRGGVWYAGEDGAAEGYAVFRYHTALPRGARGVEVEEIAWLTPAARRGLHGWLSSLGDQWDHVVYRAHPEEGFGERLRERRFPIADVPRWHYWFAGAALLQGPMFRVLDARAAWARRTVAPDAAITVALDVHDEQLPENAGPWRLRLEGGRIAVEPGASGAADLSLRLRVDVMSRLLVGALAPSAAVAAEVAETDRPERLRDLDRALRLPRPWTFDRF